MFEILYRDGLARIGKLTTTHGSLITPTLLPVYNPNIPLIPPTRMQKIGMTGLITNAYIIYNTPKWREQASRGVHSLVSFDGIIMTDSGAYQSWMYHEDLDVSNQEIVEFQDLLKPDIATILDVFTDTDSHEKARNGVETTLERAKESVLLRKKNSGVLWAGPIQGGQFLDLVQRSAQEMSELEFDYHPLGTLAPSLMTYNYKLVAEQIIVARLNMIQSRPLHAFSIGHPMFFALAIACGADLFDSSAYALFAKNNRYLTNSRTFRLEKLQEFPCTCPICLENEPRGLLKTAEAERVKLLAEHNLHVTFQELKLIREAIKSGKVWELVQERVAAHPKLLEAFNFILKKYQNDLEPFNLVSKPSAFFYSNAASLERPEIIRHEQRMTQISLDENVDVLLLVPEYPINEVNIRFRHYLERVLFRFIKEHRHRIQTAFVSPLFGLILEDLQNTYPLGQKEYPMDLSDDAPPRSLKIIDAFLRANVKRFHHFIIYFPRDLQDPDVYKYKFELRFFHYVMETYKAKATIIKNQENLKALIERIFKNPSE